MRVEIKSYNDTSLRFMFEGDLFPIDISVEELHAKLSAGKPLTVDEDRVVKQFLIFWDAYKRKDKKFEALTTWKKLTSKERELVLANVEQFVLANPDAQYRPMAVTYLNQKRWLDELTNIKQIKDPSWAKRNTW